MKQVSGLSKHEVASSNTVLPFQTIISLHAKILLLFMGIGMFMLSGCNKDESPENTVLMENNKVKSEGNVLLQYEGLDATTMWELQQARAHTARYKHLKNALKDGYVDIEVVIPGMGYHFMKMSIVDDVFDYRSPEILVYNIDEDGEYFLVAVEYAIPLALSAEAPDGFSGDLDEWTPNEEVGLWLLHAWVWHYNPLGVFSPFNPTIILL